MDSYILEALKELKYINEDIKMDYLVNRLYSDKYINHFTKDLESLDSILTSKTLKLPMDGNKEKFVYLGNVYDQNGLLTQPKRRPRGSRSKLVWEFGIQFYQSILDNYEFDKDYTKDNKILSLLDSKTDGIKLKWICKFKPDKTIFYLLGLKGYYLPIKIDNTLYDKIKCVCLDQKDGLEINPSVKDTKILKEYGVTEDNILEFLRYKDEFKGPIFTTDPQFKDKVNTRQDSLNYIDDLKGQINTLKLEQQQKQIEVNSLHGKDNQQIRSDINNQIKNIKQQIQYLNNQINQLIKEAEQNITNYIYLDNNDKEMLINSISTDEGEIKVNKDISFEYNDIDCIFLPKEYRKINIEKILEQDNDVPDILKKTTDSDLKHLYDVLWIIKHQNLNYIFI